MEAEYWRNQLDELTLADSAIPLVGRRHSPLVLVAAVLVAVLGALAALLPVDRLSVGAHDVPVPREPHRVLA